MTSQRLATHWRTWASLVFALALAISMVGVAAAAQGPSGNGGGPEQGPDHPACDNPGGGPEWCDEDGDDPGEPGEPDPDDGCTEDDYTGIQDTGVASGIVNEAKTGAEDGGAPEELTDVADTVNCEVIVTLENAIDGNGNGDDDDDDDEENGNGNGDAGECTTLVDAIEDGGAPAELTDGLRQICDAIEGDDDDDGNGEGNPVSEGCDTLVGELADTVDDSVGEAGALCEGLEAIPSPL